MWTPKAALPEVMNEITTLIINSPTRAKTTNELCKLSKASDSSILDALQELRNRGVIACASKRWYMRQTATANQQKPPSIPPPANTGTG